MQPVGFVSGQNLLVRDEAGDRLLPTLGRLSHARNVLGIGFLEETALVPRFPLRVVVLDGEKAVLKRAPSLSGIGIGVSTVGAVATSPACGSGLGKRSSACGAISRVRAISDLVEVPASRTDKDVLRVAPVLGKKAPREKVQRFSTGFAIQHLDPQKGFHRHIGVAVEGARGLVELADVRA